MPGILSLLFFFFLNQITELREGVKYYFADFVRKGGGYPPIGNSLFAENFVRNLFFGPKTGVFGQKTPFLALFEEHFSGECP